MNCETKEDRKLKVQEALSVAALGGKTVSEEALKLAQDYVDGKISFEELEEKADDLAWAGL